MKCPPCFYSYAQLFMNHLLEGVTDSPTFSGDHSVDSAFLCYSCLSLPLVLSLSLIHFVFGVLCVITVDGVPKEGLRVDDVMVRLGRIQNMEEKVHCIICLSNHSYLIYEVNPDINTLSGHQLNECNVVST